MDYILMKEEAETFVVGNLLWERIECDFSKPYAKRTACEHLTRRYLSAAQYLLDCRPDLALTWPLILVDYDQGYVDIKAKIVENTGGNDVVGEPK